MYRSTLTLGTSNLHTMKQLYYSFIYPYLSWGSACKTRLNRIRTKQNKCIPSIFFAHSRKNVKSYYNLLDILKFDNIFKHKVALFAHKIIKDPTGIPTIFSGTLPLASYCHSHYTVFLILTSIGHKYIMTMELPLFLSLHRKYGRLFHWSLKKLSYYRFSKHFKLYLLHSQCVS